MLCALTEQYIDRVLGNINCANVLLLYGFNSVYSSYCSGFCYSVLICLLCAAFVFAKYTYTHCENSTDTSAPVPKCLTDASVLCLTDASALVSKRLDILTPSYGCRSFLGPKCPGC